MSNVRLPPTPESARAGREFAREQLDGLAGPALDTALLLTSELVTNAVLHARTDLQLTVESNGRSVMLAVTDHNHGTPEERPHDAARLDGRGIALVAALSREWGSVAHPAGKTVWCVIDTAAASQRA